MQITKANSPKATNTAKNITKPTNLSNIKKEELVRLMMQSLIDLGYQ